jgi:adenylate cyclase class 2
MVTTNDQMETEVKFFIRKIESLRKRLIDADAVLLQPRVFESNLRFDTDDLRLTAAKQLVRLRRDTKVTMAYKDHPVEHQMISRRREIEFEVDDFDAAKDFLQALGFTSMLIYEKYRTIYGLGDAVVMLDEMPYGDFCEIEGSNRGMIQAAARMMELDWDAGVPDSYYVLFERVKKAHGLTMHDLTFKAFAGKEITARDFGMIAADAN